ncbi:DegT/DnrJ/EryC1/StrS family aminotransferase [Polaribacter uvawellassae]|uniref:DegT/DnrJ/EryC1/StrS family aminotransferase n=1 Tax=Polaribacter uvawellassae TaxID=3133495 RepID=UPI00321A0659
MKKINVTKTFLPSIEDYTFQLNRIWDKAWLTNRGPLALELETKLKEFLKSSDLITTTNGTLPLQIALKVLAKKGEIITTPFSYVATTASIVWENCTPVFVDIHPEYLTIDETKIESAITDKTTAILATHVFGNPCNVEVIEKIAQKNNLKIIYDAAHCFGVEYKNKSIFEYGDVSTCSFHATKIFHTGEGGAMFCSNKELFKQLFYSHNFGHKNEFEFFGLGINGKISELQAAMGLAVLPNMSVILKERRKVISFYDENLNFNHLSKIKIRNNVKWNNSYYPVIFKNENALLRCKELLNKKDIFPRRYFYPSLNSLPYVENVKMSVSEDISKKVLCLPLYVGLSEDNLKLICSIINISF